MSTRRDFITLLGGATAAWPVPVRAQSLHRIGFLGGWGRKRIHFFWRPGCRNAISTISRCETDMLSRSMRFQQVVYLRISMGSCLWTIEW